MCLWVGVGKCVGVCGLYGMRICGGHVCWVCMGFHVCTVCVCFYVGENLWVGMLVCVGGRYGDCVQGEGLYVWV